MSEHEPAAEYLDLRALALRASLSVRRLRTLIHNTDDPLPASRVGGKLVVRWSEFVAWIERRRVQPFDNGNAEQVTDEILAQLTDARTEEVSVPVSRRERGRRTTDRNTQ